MKVTVLVEGDTDQQKFHKLVQFLEDQNIEAEFKSDIIGTAGSIQDTTENTFFNTLKYIFKE